jgi:hypothetical protein
MLTSTLYGARKHFAAAVMIAYLATAISVAAIQEAVRVVETHGSTCTSTDVNMLPFEQGKLLIPIDNPDKALCILKGLDGMLEADNFFLLAYSALNLAFFLFLAAVLRLKSTVLWIFIALGLIVSVAMLCADYRENQLFRQWIEQARPVLKAHLGSLPPLPSLDATRIKWIALAVSSALLGLAYLFHPSRVAKLIILPAVAAAAVLVASLSAQSPDFVFTWRLADLAILWLAILIHAVIVAIEPPPLGLPPTAGKGEKNA